ncbi:hypothetical protein CWB41_06885 [Methylovirgula ligni]|uniref:Alkylation response protein AidB-like acyl-CoA dehydrogenase n=1 Tax=Methylovirgula ligni TaxID=569860 RepID=A0A3D9Z1Y4_9HYPH|nr:acyl-CoA dehydrogenase family protein [Methylovirgula ligni]QAY95493.1 hypothetical protein CWB41_06885 [Methylovirgula ligni]REF89174.1 alkylation response protein AidB-like acyl-CoA dehydrogenase [Methylovirgula ligni]
MDFQFTPAEEEFRREVRNWLYANLPDGWGPRSQEPLEEESWAKFRLDWERKLYQGGWSGIHWPKQYGGRGATLVEQAIFMEESARINAPEGLNLMGRYLAAPVLIKHGTEAQRQRFLPSILRAEEVWCQGFSEPNAGSDLASVRTTARRDGGDFIVNGQKIWTTMAQHAQWQLLLVRTDPEAPKHKGLSFLLLDMKTPGVTVKPLVRLTGRAGFSEVFYDDVRIPGENLVGGLNEGWRIAMTTLAFERGPEEALARQVRFKRQVLEMVEIASRCRRNGCPAIEDGAIRQKLAQIYIDVEAMRLNLLRAFSRVLQGKDPGPEATFTKLYWSHMYQRLTELALEIEGPAANYVRDDPHAIDDGSFQAEFLLSRSATIYSGTSEIQRNIIAERVLGLPR